MKPYLLLAIGLASPLAAQNPVVLQPGQSVTVQAATVTPPPPVHDTLWCTGTACSPTPPTPPPPPTVTGVVISPKTASVQAGAVRGFAASASWSDGQQHPTTFGWAATGGAVTQTGSYSPGSTAGSFIVVVVATGGKADTAQVTVTAVPPPPPPDTTPPPPPPPSAAGGCPSSGYTRLVNVSTAAALKSALSAANAGDQIRLAAGTYLGPFDFTRTGTASKRVVICGMPGVWPVIKGGGRFKFSGSFFTVTGLVFEGPDAQDVNVYFASPHDALFTHNIVRNSDWHAGMSCEGSYNVTISYNRFENNGGVSGEIDHGIYYRSQKTTPTTRNYILNNVIVGGVGRGISMHDNSAANLINYTTVAHNTIARNGSTGILLALNGGTGNIIANNVVADNGLTFNYKQIRYKSGTGNEVKNNITWSPTAAKNGMEPMGSNTVSGNLSVDPKFVSATDLHLQAGSPAIGLGLPGYATDDFEGKARDAAPDAGAYER